MRLDILTECEELIGQERAIISGAMLESHIEVIKVGPFVHFNCYY